MKKAAVLTSVLASIFCLADAKTYKTKVAILGGGVSGISAALNLTAAGIHDFIMIEARDVLGGRAQDVPFADTNVELGCNWVQGLGSNPINQLANKYNLAYGPDDGDDVVFMDATGPIDVSERYNEFDEIYTRMSEMAFKRIKKDQVDLSGRAGLRIAGWNPQTPVDHAIEYYWWDWEMGESPDVSSTIYTAVNDNWTYSAFGPESDGDKFVVDPRGFKTIFLQEAATIFKNSSDSRLKLNTVVTEIKYNSKGVKIYTNKGDVIEADYAISTFSVGVLQNQDVKWTPELPSWKIEGLYGFHMSTYTKIFMNFPTKFWGDEQYVIWVDPSQRGYFNSWQNLNKEGFLPENSTSNIFFVTATQDLSYRVESMTDEEVKDEIMTVLRRMYGNDVPEPTDILIPRWHTNPLFRGSYSNWPIGELDEHHANMKATLNNRVFFAGEAMSAEYFGFLQGAWFSGQESALQVIQCIKSKCPVSKYYPTITNAKLSANLIRRSFK